MRYAEISFDNNRHGPRNRSVAAVLQQAGLATLLMDLLTAEEKAAEAQTRHLRFDVELLAERLAGASAGAYVAAGRCA